MLMAELTEAGFDVTPTADGREALEILEKDTSWDLVLTDFAMPYATGLEVLAHVRKHLPGVPTVVMTGLIHWDLPHWETLGAAASLQKPFKARTLLDLLGQLEAQA